MIEKVLIRMNWATAMRALISVLIDGTDDGRNAATKELMELAGKNLHAQGRAVCCEWAGGKRSYALESFLRQAVDCRSDGRDQEGRDR
jgi:hypothetical protein